MKKINTVCSGFFALSLLISMSGCNKYSESDIIGNWVYTDETTEQDEYGNPLSIKEEWQYDLKKDGEMTRTLSVDIEGIEVYSLSVEGTYKYDEPSGGFDNSDAIGVIEITYDLETIKGRFNSEVYDKSEQEELEAEWKEQLKSENEDTRNVKMRSLTKDNYYGLMVVSIENDEMIVEGKDSKMTFKRK